MEIDLEYATNEQLLQELMKRQLFQGVLVYRTTEVRDKKRGTSKPGGEFRVKWTPNMTPEEARSIVAQATEALTKSGG